MAKLFQWINPLYNSSIPAASTKTTTAPVGAVRVSGVRGKKTRRSDDPPGGYSGSIFASFTIWPQRSISRVVNAASSAGLLVRTSNP